jgi:hypothetical protein
MITPNRRAIRLAISAAEAIDHGFEQRLFETTRCFGMLNDRTAGVS